MIATDIFTPDMVPDDEWLEQEKARPTNGKVTPAPTPADVNPDTSVEQPTTDELADKTMVPTEPDKVETTDAVQEEDTDPNTGKDDIENDAKKHLELMIQEETEIPDNSPKKKIPLPEGTKIRYNEDTTYTIVELKGKGGFALAYRVLLGFSEYILKEFYPNDAERLPDGKIEIKNTHSAIKGKEKFEREPRRFNWVEENLKRLSKKRVAIVHTDVFKFNGNKYFLQDMVEGESLAEFMQRPQNGDTPMTVKLALDIAEELCLAVKDIHEENVVHFDLSPDNVMLNITKDNRVEIRVIDFGLSTNVQENVDTGSALQAGTPGFMDNNLQYIPKNEQLKNIDIYSFGAILHYMLFFNYKYTKQGNETYTLNTGFLEQLNESQHYAAISEEKDEQRRKALIELIQRMTCPPDKLNYQEDFRPDADTLLNEIRNIKADMYFLTKTAKQMEKKVKASGDDRTIYFHCDSPWWVVVTYKNEGEDWIGIEEDDKNGNNDEPNFTFTVKKNTDISEREAIITITNDILHIDYIVRQEAAKEVEPVKPFIEFAKDTRPQINVSHTKGQASFSFHTNVDWEATTVDKNDLNWVKFDKNHGGSGFHTINMELKPNDKHTERTATVEVYKDETLKIQYQIVQAMKPKTVIPVQPEPPVQPESPTGQPDPVKPETPEPEPEPQPEPQPEPEPKKKDKKKKLFLPIVGGVLLLCVLLLAVGWLVYPKLKSLASRKAVVIQVEKVVGQAQQAADKILSDSSSDRPGTPEVKPTTAAQTTSDVAAPAEQSQPGPETKAPDIKSFNAAVIMALESKEWLETVLGLLHSSVAIYERYGDSDVEVGSTMRQLLQRENANIVLGKTHEVTDLYTDPATGLINEIIIEKKQ